MRISEYDFLIIGSGLAGLYSANYASKFGKVAILSKTTSEVSNSYLAQGGIAAVTDESDSTEEHFTDTVEAGRKLCNSEAVKVLVEEARARIEEIIAQGMEFDCVDGKLALGREGGHKKRRVLHAGGDATGKKLVDFFTNLVINNSKIDFLENTLVYKLMMDNGTCRGAYAYNYDERKDYLFLSKNTIIATGGASGVYKRTTNPFTSIGDGITLAYEAGAEIESMEFVQFHPTAFYKGSVDTFLISEAVRGEGAYLLDGSGKRFLKDRHELAELAPRDVVSKAIYNEIKSSGKPNVFLSLRHLDEKKMKARFSTIAGEALKHNIDISKDLIPVAPAAHYMVGGIKTGVNAETRVRGLFAIGEVASTGIHGANRLASNSLLECLVFGKRAIDYANNQKTNPDEIRNTVIEQSLKVDDNKKDLTDKLLTDLADVMNNYVGIVRKEEGLIKAIDELEKLGSDFPYEENEYFSLKIKSVLNVCRLITMSAILRKESRGGHLREDYPETDESETYLIVQQKNEEPKFLKIN